MDTGKRKSRLSRVEQSTHRSSTVQDELAEGSFFVPPRITLLCAIDESDPKVIDPVLEKVKAATDIDPVLNELRGVILNGFPNEKCSPSLPLRPFWCVRHHLAINKEDG
jgi:hypothetical protein